MSEINFDPVTLTQSLVKCASVTPKDEGALTVVENHLSAIAVSYTHLRAHETR